MKYFMSKNVWKNLLRIGYVNILLKDMIDAKLMAGVEINNNAWSK